MECMFKYIISLVSILIAAATFNPAYAKIVINEIMTSNSNVIADEDGDYPDWIEIYNSGDSTVSLDGWMLSDDIDEKKWTFPTVTLPADKYMLVFCSDKNHKEGQYLHTNFKLKSEGENIFLYESHGLLIDKFNKVYLSVDISYGRSPDASSNLAMFLHPSPGISNNNSINMNVIEFSHKPGFYLNNFNLSILKVFPSDEIYYTLDGSTPTEQSLRYTEPIPVKNRNGQPNIYSIIRTNPEDAPIEYRWEPPKSEVYKATVVRAVTYRNGLKTSKVITATYFIDASIYDRYTFPVISLVTDSLNLFGYSQGIYVPGKIHDEQSTSWYWGTGNYHQRGEEWERPVHFELFETDGKNELSQDAGVRIHGTGSRALPEKSLKFYARSEYGQNIFEYQLFPEKNKTDYKRFILRNSGQDFGRTLFADALMQDITKNTGIEFQSWRPVIVFINGEYWGIHDIRDRYDEYYLSDYCSEEPENIELYDLELVSHPWLSSHYNEMKNFVTTHDLTDDINYIIVSQYIDIENFINYNVQKIFYGVYDWPGNNVMLWRPNIPGGKWRWLSYDNDDGMMYKDLNSIHHSTTDTSSDWRNPPWSTFLLRNLLKNKNFRDNLLSTFELRMKTIFQPEYIINRINEFQKIIEPEIDEHVLRWSYPASKEIWLAFVDSLREFAIERPAIISKYMKDYFENYISGVENNYSDLQYINIYPNPNKGEFNIVILNENVILNDMKNQGLANCNVSILDVFGREVYHNLEKDIIKSGIIKCELTGIPAGIYFLNVNINNQVYTQKLIITK